MRTVLGIGTIIIGFLLLMFFCGFGSGLFGSILFKFLWFAPGDARNYDPIANFDAVYDHVGRDRIFTCMDVRYVRADGTLDLWANYDPEVSYQFVKTTLPVNAVPVGAGGNLEGVQYNMARVVLNSQNDGMNLINLIMDVDYWTSTTGDYKAAPPPTCPLRQLWSVALEKGAPELAVATIYYTADGYHFSIRDTDFTFRFDTECELKS